jgi:hypothetical protein
VFFIDIGDIQFHQTGLVYVLIDQSIIENDFCVSDMPFSSGMEFIEQMPAWNSRQRLNVSSEFDMDLHVQPALS